MSGTERHTNTERYLRILSEADNPEAEFVGIVRTLVDPRLGLDYRGPVADLVDALDISRGADG